MTWSRKKLVDLQRGLGFTDQIETGIPMEKQRALIALTLELWDKVSRIEACGDETKQLTIYKREKSL